jgi:hypothetical protein
MWRRSYFGTFGIVRKSLLSVWIFSLLRTLMRMFSTALPRVGVHDRMALMRRAPQALRRRYQALSSSIRLLPSIDSLDTEREYLYRINMNDSEAIR